MVDRETSWIDEASCATNPLNEVRAWDYDVTKYRTQAKAVCFACPVRKECLADAEEDLGSEGLRGGYMFKVRSRRGDNASESGEVSKL